MAGGETPGDEIRLDDGRSLAYAEWGARRGQPVFFFQGTPGGRLTRWWDDALPAACDVRLITVDRPGIGRSHYKRGRSVVDWADDLMQLADHLELERFPVVAFSSGGPYALACASRAPDRVSAVALASPLGRADLPGVVDEMSTAKFQKLARRSPRLMGLIYSYIARAGRK